MTNLAKTSEIIEKVLRQVMEEKFEREWVSLTDEEIAQAVGSPIDEVYLSDFRKVEAKLKEKNGG
jgi:hypothetical protein